jgi:hypothetical protein
MSMSCAFLNMKPTHVDAIDMLERRVYIFLLHRPNASTPIHRRKYRPIPLPLRHRQALAFPIAVPFGSLRMGPLFV